VNTTCQAGTCQGAPRDCSTVADACNTGVCNETDRVCRKNPRPNGTTCDDSLWCTVNDRCTSGTCGGTARDCSAAGDQCRLGVCDEAADACTSSPRPNGTSCDDALWCTTSDQCTAGTCGGTPRDCSASGNQCNDGTCSEAQRQCLARPKPDGTTCTDGRYCTVNDACATGQCVGTTRDCSAVTGGSSCFDATCSDASSQCVAVDNGTCSNRPPVARCAVTPAEPYRPQQRVTLDGSQSSDPDGQALLYTWTITRRPSGSTSEPATPSQARTDYLLDLAGEYTATLTVSDGQATSTCSISLTVVPAQRLHIELTWEADNGDLDVQLTRTNSVPLGAYFDTTTQQRSCWWNNCKTTLSWGARLDVDDVDGYGPENINILQSPATGEYDIGVHGYCDQSSDADSPKPMNARVRVYCGGQLVAEEPSSSSWRRLPNPGDFWRVGTVRWTGAGAGCEFVRIDAVEAGAKYAIAGGATSSNNFDLHCKAQRSCNVTTHAGCRPFERCVTITGGGSKRDRCVLNKACRASTDCTGLTYTAPSCLPEFGICSR
jgi:hypothetical protein